MRVLSIHNLFRSAAIITVLASASVVATNSPSFGASSIPHASWPAPVSVNPVCQARSGETVCIEAQSTGIRFTWQGNTFAHGEGVQVLGVNSSGHSPNPQPSGGGVQLKKNATTSAFLRLPGNLEYLGIATISQGSSAPLVVKFNLVVGPQTNYIVNKTLHAGKVGVTYTATALRATGGAPYTWKPLKAVPGLSLDRSTGVLSGTPTVAGLHTFTVEVTNQAGYTAKASFSIKIASA